MRNRWFHKPKLYTANSEIAPNASWLELFFDLVFVAVFLRVEYGLANNLSVTGAATSMLTTLPLWLIWLTFTLFVNRYKVDDLLHRSLVLLLMLALTGMASASTHVLGAGRSSLALFCGLAHIIVCGLYARAWFQKADDFKYASSWAISLGISGSFWLASASLPAPAAYTLWGLAICILLFGPLVREARGLSQDTQVNWPHLSHRFGLFTIILLGGSLIRVLGDVVDAQPGQVPMIEAVGSLLIITSIWWTYFDDVAGSSLRSGRASWIIWLYAHLPLHFGILILSTGLTAIIKQNWNEIAAEPTRWALSISVALVFFSVAALDSVSERQQAELSDRARINARWFTGILLLILAPAARELSAALYLGLVCALCIAQVIFDLMVVPFEEERRSSMPSGVSETPPPVSRRKRVDPADLSQAIRKGAPASVRRDVYSYFLSGSWLRIIFAFGMAFTLINIFFAALYLLEPDSIGPAHSGSLSKAFFFSVQTMSTIGYGAISPSSDYGNMIATIEAAVSMVGIAVVTGMIFAKISRPDSGVLFS
ncbi:MAG: low temperature requirement protein A, partial [Polyangiaceae bacterium]|nr:low temperature requirement protein A [Polyangiaceae bacterium]